MRTNIVLDDQLVKEAFKYTGLKTKRELINLALSEFVTNHRRRDIRELRGRVLIDPDYDYKALRAGRTYLYDKNKDKDKN